MSPIPHAVRKKLSLDPFMRRCCYCRSRNAIEWHHALIIAGKQVQKWYAILPLCAKCHRGYGGTIKIQIKLHCELKAIERGGERIYLDFPKAATALKQRRDYLIHEVYRFI